MSMKITEYNNDKSGVVIVDAEKFLGLWRNEPYSIHSAEANGNPQTWPNDRKYGAAAEGFSFGHDNPVPLAYVSHDIATRTIVSYKFLWFGKSVRYEKFHHVGFTNGVTRTIWLLTQGCMAFPIECEMPGARELHRVAAAPNTHFYTVDELAEAASHA
ncbi:plasmid fertility inhibition factor family protein [Alkalispirochaeta alkalica]|uniref:plasmid fertility inhibition factor family protein n=1 Tax=Alkalispirochaeta alkalica TaxID=46356 RepID=UPI001C024956